MAYNSKSFVSTVKRFIGGDKKALDEIYNHFYPKLYAFAKGFLKVEDDIDDILQDVFIKLWTNREKIKNLETFNSYLFAITKNAIVSYFRQKSKNPKFESQVKELAMFGAVVQDKNLEYEDLKANLDILIGQLPEKRKIIFKLSREEGLSNIEIAEKLGISKKTVEDHMLHSLRFLRKNLKNLGILPLLYLAMFL